MPPTSPSSPRGGDQATTVAFTGMGAPGTTGTFQSFGNECRFRNDGRVASVATLALGVGGVTASNHVGIWIGTSAADLQLVVRTGDVIDGKMLTSVASFASANQFDMAENGVLWVGGFGSAKVVVFSQVFGENDWHSTSSSLWRMRRIPGTVSRRA